MVRLPSSQIRRRRHKGFLQHKGCWRESALYAENNYIQLDPANDASTIIAKWGGTSMTEIGTRVNGRKVSALDAYNAANPTDTIGDDAGWTPQYRLKVDPTMSVPAQVELRAGAGKLR